MIVREKLTAALAQAFEQTAPAGRPPLDEAAIPLDVPPSPDLGDFSSTLALTLARQANLSPRQAAEALAARLELPANLVERVDVSPSGVLNFHLRPEWLHRAVREARSAGDDFGKSRDLGADTPLLVEFVSADPTGPLTVTHGRGAAVGDALANLLEWNGYRVAREFYVNDTGSQTERFGRSLDARYRQALGQADARVPADGFQGDYVAELAARLRSDGGDRYLALPADERLKTLAQLGCEAMIARQRETLERLGVRFDEWYSERALSESGKVGAVMERLRTGGHTYETDGALWLQTTGFGDTEDRPLLRSNGRPTYIAGDLAYHLDKFDRGFQHVIDIWGPEHEAYVRRTQAGMEALGCHPGSMEILIFQPVLLRVDGILVSGGEGGSGSPGNNVPLDEVIETVGRDTARFIYLSRPISAPLEFDLDLARKRTHENPACYVLQAYARARQALKGAGAERPGPDVDLTPLTQAPERALMRKLAEFPDEVRAAARERDPHRLTRYVRDAADAFDAFCRDCPIAGAGEGAAPARLALCEAAEVVLRNALRLLGLETQAGRESS
jgi:arginyl-tRNA synthetase